STHCINTAVVQPIENLKCQDHATVHVWSQLVGGGGPLAQKRPWFTASIVWQRNCTSRVHGALGRNDVANKILSELTTLQRGRLYEVGILRHHCPPAIHGLRFRHASLVVLILLVATVSLATGCGRTNAAPAVPSPEVEVAKVVQKDVPIVSEWVATLDGYVNAQIQAQVAGYVVAQKYKEGSLVRKGQILFQIDPRPFQALLDQANAQLAQAQAQLGKTEMDVGRDTPLARERAIAQSQLDNDIQANRAAKAAVKAAEAQVEE